MKKIKKNKWILGLTVAFLMCASVLFAQLIYGAYIRRSYVKAVIATNETEKLFGSNLLYGVKNQPVDPDSDTWLSVSPFTVSDPGQSQITVPIKIYNYLAEDQERVNQLDVSYIISFRVTGNPTEKNGSLAGYSVNGKTILKKNTTYYLTNDGLNAEKGSAVRQTLPGRLPNLNEYKIVFPGTDLGKVSISVKAIRVQNEDTGNYGTDLLYLAARVVPSLASTVQTATVDGSFSDENGSPEDYAAYNYDIKLSGASIPVVLSWDSSLLEVDPFFEKKYGSKPENGQVIFNMEPGITKVQFYRKGNMEGKTWDDLKVKVDEG